MGSTVVLTGTGWTPDETIDMFVNEVGDTEPWSLHLYPEVQADGTIEATFKLPLYFVATYNNVWHQV